MGSRKPSTWSVTLKRDNKHHPWGIRLAGGADLNTPLTITKVNVASPSGGNLRVGDIIRKIEMYDARDLRHLDAQNLFGNADQSITLVIQRDAPNLNGSRSSSPSLSRTTSLDSVNRPLSNPLHLQPANYTSTVNGLYGYERIGQSPVNNFCRFPPSLVDASYDESYDLTQDHQPYRTNPLVLPGAKVKRDQPKIQSYLRHHPNPMMRANPSHHDQPMDTLMKQKVTDTVLQRISNEEAKTRPGRQVVHKQFNSPIGLYSEENIAKSIKGQTGYTPLKKTVQYDPAKSETYKAIQESEYGDLHAQEISKPVQPKVFTPVQGQVKKAPVSNGHTQNKLTTPYHPHPGIPIQVNSANIRTEMSEEDVIPDTGAVFTYGKSSFADNIPSHFFIRNDPVVEISCGEEHSGIVCQNGRVFCFGKNSFGQLGLGHTENVFKPNCVKSLKPEKVKHIACGRSHTIVSTENNTIYGFGDNSDGQLGQPADVTNSYVPVEITKFDEKIVQISAGSYHTAVIIENGDVYVWGSNADRQLGLDSINDSVIVRVPTVVPIFRPVGYVSCGHTHTAFVTKAGDIFTCGDRDYGKLGHDMQSLSRVDTSEKIIQVACGSNHTVALSDAGKVFVCGNNDCGQIGLRSVTSQGHLYPCAITTERIVQITCGENHSAFITASGKLFTCGDGKYGKLCMDVNQTTIPTLVSTFVDRNLNVQMVSCGGNHTLLHAEPVESESTDYDVQNNIKSSDTLPPLKVPKKVAEERKETVESFSSIVTQVEDNDDDKVLKVVKEEIKEINLNTTDLQNPQVDKIFNDEKIIPSKLEIGNLNNVVDEPALEKEEINTKLSANNTDDKQKEKKTVTKSKYLKNERIRSRFCVVI
ncbi:Zasp-like motif,Regulator of chromosome condensation 1/beta-lactamase-inhibitor protein II,Domain [Cinara cedri]|uniref:Zasp-like motif,Regulator of chromosome condensation 1/beta-lactamase-inhibitor protein II,Domain n=1 Tax=Cinara cedri TaxID=506608 RepID=A0A5E4M4Z6_9HEMI|nr:Zasp-like motif,Regulator of chromosome condensation 1/beta-lactamase-inhibitor protein II,Domain [Cinara cedri]